METVLTSVDTGSEHWYAIRVRSGSERIVATMARNRGFQEFLPLYESRRKWSDRLKSIQLPVFPGYVFCRLDPEKRLPILTISGVMHFVGIGRVPVPIDDAEMQALQLAAQDGIRIEPVPYLEVGQQVRVD